MPVWLKGLDILMLLEKQKIHPPVFLMINDIKDLNVSYLCGFDFTITVDIQDIRQNLI